MYVQGCKTRSYIDVHMRIQIHLQRHINVHTDTHPHAHAYACVYIYVHMNTHMCVCAQIVVHACIYIYTCIGMAAALAHGANVWWQKVRRRVALGRRKVSMAVSLCLSLCRSPGKYFSNEFNVPQTQQFRVSRCVREDAMDPRKGSDRLSMFSDKEDGTTPVIYKVLYCKI